MDYRLAKELKEAGFPQGSVGKGGMWLSDPNDNHKTEPPKIKDVSTDVLDGAKMLPSYMFKPSVWSPSLSELIEACGDEFQNLNKGWKEEYWIAQTPFRSEAIPHNYQGVGTTPEEAVARLWLALNRKEE